MFWVVSPDKKTENIEIRLHMIKLWLKYGAKIDVYAFENAVAEKGYLPIAELMIKHGADVNGRIRKCEDIPFPLDSALENVNFDAVKFLLANGAIVTKDILERSKWKYQNYSEYKNILTLLESNHTERSDQNMFYLQCAAAKRRRLN